MIVILDNLRSALNVGSIIRTCDALGIKQICLCVITPDQTNPKVKKTALGAEKNVTFSYFKTTMQAVTTAKSSGCKIIALELTSDATPINSAIGSADYALVVGNEVSGVANDILDMSDQKVMIPMKGIKESLNVSVAFGIAAFTIIENTKPL